MPDLDSNYSSESSNCGARSSEFTRGTMNRSSMPRGGSRSLLERFEITARQWNCCNLVGLRFSARKKPRKEKRKEGKRKIEEIFSLGARAASGAWRVERVRDLNGTRFPPAARHIRSKPCYAPLFITFTIRPPLHCGPMTKHHRRMPPVALR